MIKGHIIFPNLPKNVSQETHNLRQSNFDDCTRFMNHAKNAEV